VVLPLVALNNCRFCHWWLYTSGGFAIGGFKQVVVLPLVALNKWWFCHWWL
jgi:hypothetical protein